MPERPGQTQQQPVPQTPNHPPPLDHPHQEQPLRDTTHGHPGLPPKDYKQPREK